MIGWLRVGALTLVVATLVTATDFDNNDTMGNMVTLFHFLPEQDIDNSAKVSVRYEVEVLTTPLTLCFWLRPSYQTLSGVVLFINTPHCFLILRLVEGELWATINPTGMRSFSTPELDAYTWHHLCLALTHDAALLHLDATEFRLSLSESLPFVSDQTPATNHTSTSVQLGSVLDGFVGELADLRLFGRHLSSAEILELSECGDPGPQDYLTVADEFVGGNVVRAAKSVSVMCRPTATEHLALFNMRLDLQGSRKFCESLSGRLINQTDDLSEVGEQVMESRDVSGDARLVWTGNTVSNTHAEAIFLFRKSTGDYIVQKLTRQFTTALPITACFLPVGKTVYMKDNEVKEFKFLPRAGKLLLLSDAGDVILKTACPSSDKYCLVHSNMGNPVQYSPLPEGSSILGRKTWTRYDTGHNVTVTLSSCGTGDFTCDNGQCVKLSMRCDGQPQCSDHSDEAFICFPLINRHYSYWQSPCPSYMPQVNLSVRLHGVNEILLDTNEFTAILSVTTIWRDDSLLFANLNNLTRFLPKEAVENMWVPEILFSNARYEDNLNIRTRNGILEKYTVHAESPGVATVLDGYEVLVYKGSEVPIHRSIQYLFTFSCKYELLAFPFDTQECTIQLQLAPLPGCRPYWNTDSNGIVAEGNDTTISMYDISHIRFMYNKSSRYNDVISMSLLFYRKFEAYLLTTFVPCIILYSLSELTLVLFRLESFTDRITVTISILIVIASLFSQVTASLPSSPTPKCVDWFFFYCIVRVSVVFFLHSIIDKKVRSREREVAAVDHLPVAAQDKKVAWNQEQDKGAPRKPRFNTAAIINNCGMTTIIITDIVVITFFTFWITNDQGDKYDRFINRNISQIFLK